MASTTGWLTSGYEIGAPGNDQTLNNSSCFNAFPSGGGSNGGGYSSVGYYALFWSSTECSVPGDDEIAYGTQMNVNLSAFGGGCFDKGYGYTVRLVKD